MPMCKIDCDIICSHALMLFPLFFSLSLSISLAFYIIPVYILFYLQTSPTDHHFWWYLPSFRIRNYAENLYIHTQINTYKYHLFVRHSHKFIVFARFLSILYFPHIFFYVISFVCVFLFILCLKLNRIVCGYCKQKKIYKIQLTHRICVFT